MRLLFFLLFIGMQSHLVAQIQLSIQCPNCPKTTFETTFENATKLTQYLQSQQIIWLKKGFAEASIDRLIIQDSMASATIHLGQRYLVGHINTRKIPKELIPNHQLLSDSNVVFSPLELGELLQKINTLTIQNGYPLAKVSLKDIQIKKQILSATIDFDKGPFFQYGPTKVKGNSGLKPQFIQNHLRIFIDKAFDIRDIQAIKQKIAELDYVQLSNPPKIQFLGNQAIVTLHLQEKKANQFNFLIGVLPNNAETNKLLLVGNILLDLKNMLGFGERFFFAFDQTKPQTQKMALKTSFPYPINLPIGIDVDFDLYKQDTTHLSIHSQLGVKYYLSRQNYLKLFWNNQRSTLLSINKNQLILSKRLPNNLDFRTILFGVEFGLSRLDHPFTPRKGWDFHINTGAGFTKYPRNPKILETQIPSNPTFTFSSLYDSIALKTWKIQSSIQFNGYIPIFKKSVLALGNQTGLTLAPALLRQNELYRIGGHKIMRGFNEESIPASIYAVSTLEYRLLLGQLSYLYAFTDYGWIQSPDYINQEKTASTNLVGFGAGMSFQTKAGIFRVSYALGKPEDHPIDTRSSKIHLGFKSLF